ncbi:MAG: beta-lactamase family protein [Saprospiraceae bacterium]|nr:beta-lactamase family protein [Saprospiraceae bacterium]
MKQKTFITLLFLLNFSNLFAQNDFKEIDVFLEKQMQTWHIPNISIAITNKDDILYIKEFGDDKSKGNYLIGSVSKPFTAIATMQLVEQGKVNLDDLVKLHLPWFETNNKTISDKITIRHLLNQTSGLTKNAGFFTPQSQNQSEIESAYKNYLLSLNADELSIGKHHIYCNLNYQLLGQIIQKISGLKFADYLNKYIFSPCNMKNTFATYRETQSFGLKNGYQYLFGYPIKRSFEYNDNGIAAGDIASNTKDLSKFLQVLLKNGQIGNDSLLSKNTLSQMHTPFSNRYGMGFSIGNWNGLHSIRHSGLTKNYSSAINILPNQNYGIVILTNINSFYAVRNLMDGVIIRLNNQEKVAYIPYEIYFRYAILALFLWSFIEFLLRLNKWRKLKFAFNYSKNKNDIFWLLISILVAFSWLVTVPYFAKIPLLSMTILQPDLGYTLFIGVIIGMLSGIVLYFIKSNTNVEKPHPTTKLSS